MRKFVLSPGLPGLNEDPTRAKPTKTMNWIVLQIRSYIESRAKRTSCSVTWNQVHHKIPKKPTYAIRYDVSVMEW